MNNVEKSANRSGPVHETCSFVRKKITSLPDPYTAALPTINNQCLADFHQVYNPRSTYSDKLTIFSLISSHMVPVFQFALKITNIQLNWQISKLSHQGKTKEIHRKFIGELSFELRIEGMVQCPIPRFQCENFRFGRACEMWKIAQAEFGVRGSSMLSLLLCVWARLQLHMRSAWRCIFASTGLRDYSHSTLATPSPSLQITIIMTGALLCKICLQSERLAKGVNSLTRKYLLSWWGKPF